MAYPPDPLAFGEYDEEDAYLESLPEANAVEDILRAFLDAVRHAVTLADVNVAAGIALQRLAA